jgi:phosphatidylinositol dimannoside acyltransferase
MSSEAGRADGLQATGPAPNSKPTGLRRLRQAAADFWLRAFFWSAEHLPGPVAKAAPLFSSLVFRVSPTVRRGTLANARRLLGPDSSETVRAALAQAVVANFYRFCCDVAYAAAGASEDDLVRQIESVEGAEHFQAARAAGKGLVVVTAHMGSFEVGIAALKREVPRVHVVFRRDSAGRFERQRAALRNRLGVVEVPVDEGWTLWMRLRDALLAGEAVVLQADRVMPGQKGRPVPFLGGMMLLPTGPAKLAAMTGAPIVPVFTIRAPSGRVRVMIEPPIVVSPGEDEIALGKIAAVLERYVKTYPEQWLMLQPAWREDGKSGS